MTDLHRVGYNALHGVLFSLKNKGGNTMEEKRFLTAQDVAKFMGISVPMAYKIIRRLNDELVASGYITVSGRISRCYFEKKVYGGLRV